MHFLSAVLLLLTPISLALPTTIISTSPLENSIDARACLTTCGSTCYTAAQVAAASSAGHDYVTEGGTAGGTTYPHVYNNYEDFDFLVAGPYYEFPIKSSGTFTGGNYSLDPAGLNRH
jgi:hypothetical protein